jgi:uncharacterized protein YkwD
MFAAAATAVHRTIPARLRTRQVAARVIVATLALAVALGASLEGASAGLPPTREQPLSLLPTNVGVGVRSLDAVAVTFAEPMDRAAVEAALVVQPHAGLRVAWSSDGRTMRLSPATRWLTDARYVITIPSGTRLASGGSLGVAHRVSFTTQTAPVVADFQLRYVAESDEQRMRAIEQADLAPLTLGEQAPPPDTANDVSATTSITVAFSTMMDTADVERRFSIAPSVAGELSWNGSSLVFTPSERLAPDARYAVSVAGAHDAQGNKLRGDASFSFTTRTGAQVVKVSPASKAKDVADGQAIIWFSQPMDQEATRAALSIIDARTKAVVTGKSAWNEAGTQLRFTFNDALPLGHAFTVSIGEGASDLDGNPVSVSWGFSTKAPPPPPPAPRPVVRTSTGPAAPADMIQYALWQVNQDRARYGFGPLVLDSAISAVASAHAWDQINYGYFSHTGRDGSRVSDRLRRAGISFSWSGENLCYYNGIGLRAMLDWCNSTFMAEPYPGYANHIGNILSPRFTRLGVGIAQKGGRVIIVWNFAG